jgi:hypothetical protein
MRIRAQKQATLRKTADTGSKTVQFNWDDPSDNERRWQ